MGTPNKPPSTPIMYSISNKPVVGSKFPTAVTAISGIPATVQCLATPIPEKPLITSPEDGTTTDNLPIIEGTGNPGDTIRVVTLAQDLLTLFQIDVIVNLEGNWFFTPPEPLPDDNYQFQAFSVIPPNFARSDDMGITLSIRTEPPDDGGVPVGGELIPIDTTSLLLVGTQLTASWMIPVIVSAVGIGLVFVRKSKNS